MEGAPRVIFVAAGIVLWGLFASPKATYDIAWLTIAVKVLVFGVAAIGLWAMGRRTLAIVFAIAVVVLHIAAALPARSTVRATPRRSRVPARRETREQYAAGAGPP